MKNRFSGILPAGIGFLLVVAATTCIAYSTAPSQSKLYTETAMNEHAKGTFEVKVVPQSEPEKGEGATLSRMSIDKQFHGDLEATSKGEMLSAMTDVKGSAGYVAIERVTGILRGRSGSFVLQHNATMTRGTPQLNIIVVPDSGTGQLTGIAGNMKINIVDGKHYYEFDYSLAPQH